MAWHDWSITKVHSSLGLNFTAPASPENQVRSAAGFGQEHLELVVPMSSIVLGGKFVAVEEVRMGI